LLAEDEFLLEIIEERIVQIELPLEGAIGHPSAALEQVHDLAEHVIKVHHRPSSPQTHPLTQICRPVGRIVRARHTDPNS
jgi:hypothetical protein